MSHPLREARETIRSAAGVVILTGAGVSAESGIPTFRDAGGFWEENRVEDLATPEGFARDPRRVWEWYEVRRRAVLDCRPNPGHTAIARFLRSRDDALLVTQNVDALHRRALSEGISEDREPGPTVEPARSDHPRERPAAEAEPPTSRVLELHGNLLRNRCSNCAHRDGEPHPVDASSVETLPRCPSCDALMRPDVVWFGEWLDEATLTRAFDAAGAAEVCIVAGTSALVHPAASVPGATLESGGTVIEVNPEVTPLTQLCQYSLRGPGGTVLPEILAADGVPGV